MTARHTLREIQSEVDEFLADGVTEDLGNHLTCSEADALANVFRLVGREQAATNLIDVHADSDSEEDWHYRGDG